MSENDTPILSSQKLLRRRRGRDPSDRRLSLAKVWIDRDPRGEHSSADAQRTSRNSWALRMMILQLSPPDHKCKPGERQATSNYSTVHFFRHAGQRFKIQVRREKSSYIYGGGGRDNYPTYLPPCHPNLSCPRSLRSNHSGIFWFSQIYQTYTTLQGYCICSANTHT